MRNWPTIRVADEFDLQMGKTPARDNPAYWGGEQKWASIADIARSGMYLSETKEAITQEAVSESGIKAVPQNTVVMSFKLSLGRTAITASRMYTNEAIMAFLPHDATAFDLHFLYHLFSNRNWSEGCNKAVKGVTLNKATLNAARIPKPCISEQRVVASTLDKICDLISKCDEQLVRLDQLVKSRFVEMFGEVTSNPMGWIKERLESHIDVLAGYPFDSSQYVEGGGINICGGLIIMPGWIDWSQCKKWRSAREVEEYLLDDGDIVMALDRPWISTGFKVAQVHKEELPALLIQRTARIRGVDIDQSFLLYLLKDRAFELHCTVTGSLVPHISHKDIRSYEVIVPPLALQREFAAFVAKVDKLAFAVRKSLESAEKLYRQQLSEAFA